MKYEMHCTICLENDIWHFDDNEIDEIECEENVTSVDHNKRQANHICAACTFKIISISGSEDFQHSIQSQVEQLRREVNASNAIIQGNQKGMQNVYDEFKKITDEKFLVGLNQTINEYKAEFRKIRAELYEMNEFVRKGMKSIGAVNDLYRLSKKNPHLIKKMARIIEMLGEDDEA